MRQIKEILRQKLNLKRSNREVATSLGLSPATVVIYTQRLKAVGLDEWHKVEGLSEEQIETALYGPKATRNRAIHEPDCAALHLERQRPGVTLWLLHQEYLQAHPQGLKYTAYCDRYRQWLARHKLSMRQVHLAGEKCFIDYSGKKPHYINPDTGEEIEVELFVAVLGASSYIYAEATLTQKLEDFIESNKRAFFFFGGVPHVLVPDQLKSAITTPGRYEAGVNRTYQELAAHCGTTVIPARPRKPKDKPKAEVSVQIVQRFILAALRNRKFFSLVELNAAIFELLEKLNQRVMRQYKVSRKMLFEKYDKPALLPLPKLPFVMGEWSQRKVHIDYHVSIEGHFYSCPFRYVSQTVEARVTATTVELFIGGEKIAAHLKNSNPGGHTTDKNHMPKSHQAHSEWSAQRFTAWAQTIGPMTKAFTEALFEKKSHPELAYRSLLGVLHLSKTVGPLRLEAACNRALHYNLISYKHVASILSAGVESAPLEETHVYAGPVLPAHENVRGAQYYSQKQTTH